MGKLFAFLLAIAPALTKNALLAMGNNSCKLLDFRIMGKQKMCKKYFYLQVKGNLLNIVYLHLVKR